MDEKARVGAQTKADDAYGDQVNQFFERLKNLSLEAARAWPAINARDSIRSAEKTRSPTFVMDVLVRVTRPRFFPFRRITNGNHRNGQDVIRQT